MNYKVLIPTTVVFFILVNTSYFWEYKLGVYAMPATFAFVIVFLGLGIILVRQIYLAAKEKFKDKQRIFSVILLATVLVLTYFFPLGIINFEKLSGNDVLIAEHEGAANCMTILKLKDNYKFTEKNVCFGLTEVNGNYKIINDTIYFYNIKFGRNENEYYEFAVIKPSKFNSKKDAFDLVRFKNKSDTTGNGLWITKNELKSSQTKAEPPTLVH